jgi:hypothetical protein
MGMKQMVVCLLAEMNAMQEKLDSSEEEAKIEAEIRTPKEKVDAKIESLTSWMGVNKECLGAN